MLVRFLWKREFEVVSLTVALTIHCARSPWRRTPPCWVRWPAGERDKDMRQSLCRCINNKEGNERAVHRRGSMQLPARLKSLKWPKAIAQIRPRHETQRYKDKSRSTEQIEDELQHNMHRVPNTNRKISREQAKHGSRAPSQSHACYDTINQSPRCGQCRMWRTVKRWRVQWIPWPIMPKPGRDNTPLQAVYEATCHHASQRTNREPISNCYSALRALGSTSEVGTPSCSRAATRLRSIKTHRSLRYITCSPSAASPAEPRPSTDTLWSNTRLCVSDPLVPRLLAEPSLHSVSLPTNSIRSPGDPDTKHRTSLPKIQRLGRLLSLAFAFGAVCPFPNRAISAPHLASVLIIRARWWSRILKRCDSLMCPLRAARLALALAARAFLCQAGLDFTILSRSTKQQ